MDYITALIGLIGVVIGGWLSPWLTSKIEYSKIKKSIRLELIEKIYVFFNLRKAHILVTNFHNYKVQATRFAIIESLKPNNTNIAILQKLIEHSDPKDDLIKSDQYFEQLIEIESKMISLICQSQQYYSNEIYKKLDNLIKPEIDKSNQSNNLYDYSNLSADQLQKVSESLPREIHEATLKLNPICDSIIDKVMKILKN